VCLRVHNASVIAMLLLRSFALNAKFDGLFYVVTDDEAFFTNRRVIWFVDRF
jgi:hypothetical protein